MSKFLSLKNSNKRVLVSDDFYNHLITDSRLSKLNVIKNLRLNDRGFVEFRRSKKDGRTKRGSRRIKIQLHRVMASIYLDQPEGYVVVSKKNKLDLRPEKWLVLSKSELLIRSRRYESKTGLRGAYEDGDRYKAQISINRQSIYLGMYGTAEEANKAYKKKARQLKRSSLSNS